MKILLINNYHYLRGGAERSYLDTGKILEKNGHEVAYFSMFSARNIFSGWSRFFAKDSETDGRLAPAGKISAALNIFYNCQARKKLKELLKEFNPDIAHLHNIYHHLSPSIIHELKKRGIPTVMTLHDYKLTCPNYKLFNKNKYCDKCVGGKYYNCFFGKCVKNSYVKSFLAAFEAYFQRHVLKSYSKIDLFIAPSRFIKNIIVSSGIKEEKVKVINNFVNQESWKAPAGNEKKDYLLYFGRLSKEKGIDTLMEALVIAKTRGLNLKLKIAGSGPDKENLELRIKNLELNDSAELLGPKYGDELKRLIIGAKAVIIPSLWPENMPFALLESLAAGKIVIASNIGGIAEIIKHGQNGLLFKTGSADDLAAKLTELDAGENLKIETNAAKTVKGMNAENYMSEISAVYSGLMNS
ncbi:MAG: glycosyltransferase family 4 protein [Patescibacteria group bacterium]|jgi:glycosyltransferase involved in cell wall biosynthesis